jgi:glycosyltransferase involved in cell wall biosynthesis
MPEVSMFQRALDQGAASVAPASRVRPSRRVLLVSYHFPPVGGAGVQRAAKFVKFLRRFGWEPSVLAARDPSVPVLDESLVADVPSDIVVERATTWEPGFALKRSLSSRVHGRAGEPASLLGRAKERSARALHAGASLALQPDPQVLWLPSAVRAGARLLERTPHHAIVATAPSYTNLLVGVMLKRRFHLPLVLDFRDEWEISVDHEENRGRDPVSRAVQARMQRELLRQADAITATTEASARRLRERVRAAGGRAEVTCIYNGFDDADVARPARSASVPRPEGEGFSLVYTGTLWALTDVEPLVQAIERLAARAPGLLGRLQVTFVGRKTEGQMAHLERLARAPCRLRVEAYCDHEQALGWMSGADALCVLLSDGRGAARVVPAKLFEYMAMQREILAIAPEGEAAALVREHRAGRHFTPDDIAGIAGWLEERIRGARAPAAVLGDHRHIQRFSRAFLTGQLAEILDDLAPARPRPSHVTPCS